jgi:phosphatidylglycerophosphate synthase
MSMSQVPKSLTASPFRHVPNALTWLRIFMALLFPFASESWHLTIILIAMATEFLDGFLARIFNWHSYFGQVLDPIADKLFFLSVSMTWVWLGKLSLYYWVLLSTRDLGVLLVAVALMATGRITKAKSVKAKLLSKITTLIQYLVFLAILFQINKPISALVTTAAIVGVLAALQYTIILWKENK